MAPMGPAGAAMAPMPSPSAAPLSGKLAVDSVPFINERIRNYLPRGSVKIPRVWSLETPPPDDRRQRR
ncbi:hypothetical protein ABIF68_001116 [Bradyrhizobium japonicum]